MRAKRVFHPRPRERIKRARRRPPGPPGAQIQIFDPSGCESISHRFSHLYPNAPKTCRGPPLSALDPLFYFGFIMLFKIVPVGYLGDQGCRRIIVSSIWGCSGNPRGGPRGSLGAPKSKNKASVGSFGPQVGLLSNLLKCYKTAVKDSKMHTRAW